MDKNGDVEDSLKKTLEGKPDDSGKPDDAGKPDDPKKTEGADDKGNLDEKGGSQTPSPTMYTLPGLKNSDGSLKQLTAEQVIEEANRITSENTKLFEENRQLKEGKKPETQSKEDGQPEKPELSSGDQAVLSELKRLGVITEDKLDEYYNTKERGLITKASQISVSQVRLDEALGELKEDYPFVEKDKVLQFIIDNPNTQLTPLDIAKAVYTEKFIEIGVKEAKEKETNLPETEGSGVGQGGNTPPAPKYNFQDGSAERAVSEIVTGAAK